MPVKRPKSVARTSRARLPRGRRHGARARSAAHVMAALELQRVNRHLSRQLRALRDQQGDLERARAHYAELFDFAPVPYTLLNTAGIIQTINLAGCRLLNLERRRLIGHPLLTFVLQEDRREILEHLRRCRAGRDVVESEVRLATQSDSPVICRLYSRRAWYVGSDGFPTLIVDQSERLSLDEARLAAVRGRNIAERDAEIARSASAAKDRFLAAVSHELRTPLTPALFAAGRLASWHGLPPEARALASTIKQNVEFEARLIDDLLDVARIDRERLRLRLETVDLHEIVNEAIRICYPSAENRGVAIRTSLSAVGHHVRGDRTRLRQVFWNLLNNAIKFTDAGGEILVRSIDAAGGLIRMSIRDSGAGMASPVLQHLFAPFDRRPDERESRAGLGLGLAICKGIVAAHDGQIGATSDGPGLGSTFAVELRTVAEPGPRQTDDRLAAPSRVIHGEQRSIRVLVIEDDADSGEMLRMFLSSSGFEVEAASSVREAVNKLNRSWDIVLSDIGLPDGSGLEIARRARRLTHPPQRLIAFTGYGSSDDIRASREAGFDDHVVKPIDLDGLLERLNGVLAPRMKYQ